MNFIDTSTSQYHPPLIVVSIIALSSLPFLTISVTDILPHYASKEEAKKKS
jgi:hypothetical protein